MITFLIDPTWVIAVSIIILAIATLIQVVIANKSIKASKETAAAYEEQTTAIIALKESLESITWAINKLPGDLMSAEDHHKQIEKIIRERNINTLVKTHKTN
jgi:pantothenate kinase